jgi:UDP:flavonoid glycosyltransferase YjiC (YdhE family)
MTNGHVRNTFEQHGHLPPNIIMTALPESGHHNPLIQIAAYLTKRGYRVFFLGGLPFADKIRAAGAEFHQLPAHVTADRLASLAHEFPLPDGMDPPSWYIRRLAIEPMAARHAALVTLMEEVRRRHSNEEVVIVRDAWSSQTLPLWFGAPLPRGYDTLPKIIGISTLFLMTYSVDVPPYFQDPPLVELPSKEVIARLWKKQEPWQRDMVQRMNEALKPLGCQRLMEEPWVLDGKDLSSDVLLVACNESLDLHRSDLQPHVHYVGGLPSKGADKSLVYPEWWPKIIANAKLPNGDPAKKKVVLVTQGTVAIDHSQLLMPTLEALRDREEVIAIALLGQHGRALPNTFNVPANAHVLDYFPYEAILPYADVMVSNAGFGSLMHSMMHGVPMVLGGLTEDKPKVSLRAARAGLAVNLQTATPTIEATQEAVDRVLKDGKFKKRAAEMMQENEELDFFGTVENWVWKVQDGSS